MWKAYFGFIVGFASFACGESSGDSGSVGATGGETAAGASGAGVGGQGAPAGSGGGSASGAAGALQGGSATSGGTTGTAGTDQGDAGSGGLSGGGTAGASGGSSTKPSGSVETCFGSSCPMGECDNALFFADIACTANWPPPLGPSTPYCPSDLNAGYCLTVQSSALEDWSVMCTNGAPRLRKCPAGCATSEDTSWCL